MLTINLVNFGQLTWTRSHWVAAAGESNNIGLGDEVLATPSETLSPNDGSSQAQAESVHMSGFTEDCLYIEVGYTSEAGSFGVGVYQRFHQFGIGKQCEWAVLDQNWKGSATNNTSGQTLTLSSATIIMTPTLSDSDGSVQVNIS